MIITQHGRICDDFYVAGPSLAPLYLLDGEAPVLFEGGFSALAYLYEAGLKERLAGRSPAWLFITHSHFDHIGAVSHIQKIWPEIKIAAAPKCREILSKQRAVQTMQQLSLESCRGFQTLSYEPIYEKPFTPFSIDLLVAPGTAVEISSTCTVMPLNTPGHTWDFMSYYIPEKKILIASEAVAVYETNGDIQTEFLVDANAYLDSLEKMKTLEIDVLCAGHYAVFTGADAARHIDMSIEVTNRYLKMAEHYLKEESHDIEQAACRIRDREWRDRPMPKQSETAYMINTRQRLNVVLSQMRQTHGPESV